MKNVESRPSSLPAAGFVRLFSATVLRRLCLALMSAAFVLAGLPSPLAAAPDDGVKPVNIHPQRPIKTDPVGPTRTGPVTDGVGTALLPNDLVLFDYGYTGTTGAPDTTNNGAIVNLSVRNGGTGTESILASATVGSGVAYHDATYSTGDNEIAVSPDGLIYYIRFHAVGTTPYDDVIELNPVTGLRRVVSDGTNTSLGVATNDIIGLCYDYSTASLLISLNTSNTAVAGIYRVNIATGVRTLVMLNTTTANGVYVKYPQYLATDPFGNIFYLDDSATTTGFFFMVEIPVTADSSATYGGRKYVASNSIGNQNGAPFDELVQQLQIDNTRSITLSGGLPTNEYVITIDEGNAQTNSDIFRIPVATGDHVRILGYSGTAANTGSAVFDLPASAQTDSTGRIYYIEQHNYANGNTNNVDTVNFIPAGTTTDTVLSSAQNISQYGLVLRIVPPPTPTLAAGTVSNNTTGTTATLNSNVTADGGVANAGIFQRGFVYSTTATSSAPKIGGTGVTQVSTLSLTSLPATQGTNLGAFTTNVTGLTSGTSYTFSAYARDYSGITYTTPVTFTTVTAPSVTTNAASVVAGTTATLNGNVTSDGGASLTTRGFVYSSSNQTPVIGGTGVTNLADSGTATGAFADGITGLTNGTTYYFRAYAINGVSTTYGSVLTFKTVAQPTANAQSVTTAFNTATAITLTGSDPNTPAQTLTYAIVTSPTHGTLSGTAPNLTYTPTAGYNGTDSFTFTTTNTSGLTSNVATVSITVTPGTPTANSQSVSVPFNTATAITLTASDPDSPALSLTYTVVASPAHGTLSGTAPNLTYTPTANYQGADSFTFRVSNGTNTSNTATVSITVAAGTPTANAQSVTTAFNTAKAITLTGTDPDSPALSLTYTVTTAPTHGTLSGTAPNLTYTPAANYQGADSFTFTVSNGQKTSSVANVSITVVAGTPTANAQSVNAYLNTAKTITLTGTDPDSPALALTYTVLTAPANGTLSGTAPNLTYTPTAGYAGTDSFTFRVSNGTNTSNTATVSITVFGQPVFTGFTASGAVGSTVTLTGTNFTGATAVTFFRNIAATSFTVVSDTQITVTVPAGATTGTLRVTTPAGTSTTPAKFTVTP